MNSTGAEGTTATRRFEWLAYAGVLPFLVGIALSAAEVRIAGIDGRFWFTAYSSVILSFLCGIWWGGALNTAAHAHRVPLMVWSNVIALVGWVALLFYQSPFALPVLAVAYLVVERAEAYLKPNRGGLDHYFRTRTRVTWLVVICHVAMILLW